VRWGKRIRHNVGEGTTRIGSSINSGLQDKEISKGEGGNERAMKAQSAHVGSREREKENTNKFGCPQALG